MEASREDTHSMRAVVPENKSWRRGSLPVTWHTPDTLRKEELRDGGTQESLSEGMKPANLGATYTENLFNVR